MTKQQKFFISSWIISVVTIVMAILIVGQSEQKGKSLGSQILEDSCFSASVPDNWELEPLAGTDSAVSVLRGSGLELFTDCGWYSESLSIYVDNHDYRSEIVDVDGFPALVVVPEQRGRMGIHFSDLGDNVRLTIATRDSEQLLTDDQKSQILDIFWSIEIK